MCQEGLTQRTLLKVDEVLLEMLRAGRADDDGVTKLTLEKAVMRDPAKRDLSERQTVLVAHRLHDIDGLEVRVVPVPVGGQQLEQWKSHSDEPLAVRLALLSVCVEALARSIARGGVLSSEEPSGNWMQIASARRFVTKVAERTYER